MNENLQPLLAAVDLSRLNKYTVGLGLAAANPSAELMKLGQTEPFRIFNHHHRSIRHIDADFDNGRGYEHLNLIIPEPLHNRILPGAVHLSVKIFHTNMGRQNIFQPVRIVDDILQIHHFTFFDHRADNVDLMAFPDLFLNKTIGRRTVSRIHHTVFDRLSPGRKFIND